MSLSRRASWDSIALEKEVPVQRSSSESDLEILTNKRNFPPVPVNKNKLSLFIKIVPHKYSTRSQVDLKQAKLLEIGEPNPQAIGKSRLGGIGQSHLFPILHPFLLVFPAFDNRLIRPASQT
jgi:hypothetical protein